MNPENQKLRHTSTTRGEVESTQEQGVRTESSREFATPEELLAFDRRQAIFRRRRPADDADTRRLADPRHYCCVTGGCRTIREDPCG